MAVAMAMFMIMAMTLAFLSTGANLGSGSPVEYTVPTSASVGDYLCFACQVGGHCSGGQYIIVKVVQPAGHGRSDVRAMKDMYESLYIIRLEPPLFRQNHLCSPSSDPRSCTDEAILS